MLLSPKKQHVIASDSVAIPDVQATLHSGIATSLIEATRDDIINKNSFLIIRK